MCSPGPPDSAAIPAVFAALWIELINLSGFVNTNSSGGARIGAGFFYLLFTIRFSIVWLPRVQATGRAAAAGGMNNGARISARSAPAALMNTLSRLRQ